MIVTTVLTAPDAGEKSAMLGGGSGTVKAPEDAAVPMSVDTEMVPLVAAAGTLALIEVELFTVKPAAMPLKATAVAPVKPV
ncbi:MAG TPA: hypothetical protein VK643_08940, partial [Burkholderiales bacterium]|nr:hypothetical protein [Burkholderiales bacterium]